MTSGLAMRRIVLPQAARVIVPPLGNEFNNMLKTTSLLAFIGLTELFQDAEIHYSQTFKPVEYFTAVAFWYLVLTTIWSLIQARIERKLGASDRGDELSMRERFAAAWSPEGVGSPMNDGAVVMRAEDVHKCFGRLEVLKGVSMDARRDRVRDRPSGSGKTTFIRCVNHLEKIDAGRIEVNGKLIGYREQKGSSSRTRALIAKQRTHVGWSSSAQPFHTRLH
jgi:ABC-type multidrug transport system fused ATPase/permease subunit